MIKKERKKEEFLQVSPIRLVTLPRPPSSTMILPKSAPFTYPICLKLITFFSENLDCNADKTSQMSDDKSLICTSYIRGLVIVYCPLRSVPGFDLLTLHIYEHLPEDPTSMKNPSP
jgi:hypothetical protein